MDYYPLIKPLLHFLPPEKAHDLALKAIACGAVPRPPAVSHPSLRTDLAGLALDNPVGLAAGFDKNAATLRHIFDYGFGFVECGTVTPKPQKGNPQPRLFRLPRQQAVVNRLGFNNAGLEPFIDKLKAHRGQKIVGANIGKNKDSAEAIADYVLGLRAVYAHADYVTINISSPNTKGLRDLQSQDSLASLIIELHEERQQLMQAKQPRRPIFIKIAPDLSSDQRQVIADIAMEYRVDGLVVSNTTITRPGFTMVEEDLREGGLSGRPLFALSTAVLRDMYRATEGKIPLIGVGGIANAAEAYIKIKSGASAVQLYTALIYQGFGLVSRINEGLIELLKRDGHACIRDAVGKDAQ